MDGCAARIARRPARADRRRRRGSRRALRRRPVFVGGGVVILLAALTVGFSCALLAGHLVGQPLRFRRWQRTRPSASGAEVWLAQAGLTMSPRQFAFGSVAVGVVAFAAGYFVTGAALVAIVPAFAA